MLKVVKTSRNKSGELILSISFDNVQLWLRQRLKRWVVKPVILILKSVFLSLDQVTNDKTLPTLFMALGLGVGLAMATVVARQPSYSLARPAADQTSLPPKPSLVAIKDSHQFLIEPVDNPDRFFLIPSGKQVVLTVNGNDQTTLLGVGFYSQLSNSLKETQLGDTIQMIGKNGGIYSYQVIEIRHLSRKNLSSLLNQTKPSLIVVTPTNLTQTQLVAAVAR